MSFNVDIKHEQSNFLELMFKSQTGKVCIGTRWGPTKEEFGRKFFKWPAQQEDILTHIQVSMMESREVYFSPDIFFEDAQSYHRDNVFGSYWIAADSDGNAPSTDRWDNDEFYKNTPRPTAVIQSSTPGNKHFYWEIPWTTDIQLIQDMRRYVIHNLDADTSGWDAGQLLRIPYTMNYGYTKSRTEVYEVYPEEINPDRRYTPADFPAPTNFAKIVEEEIDTNHLTPLFKILSDNEFHPDFTEVYGRDKKQSDRSGSLFQLAHILAESNNNKLSNEDMYVILLSADNRWGKYAGRADQKKQLSRLIATARRKHPYASEIDVPNWGVPEEGINPIMSYGEVLAYDRPINWFLENLLTSTGTGIIAAQSNTGKSQIGLTICKAVSLGKPIFSGLEEWENKAAGGVVSMFLSLEMDITGVKYFIDIMKANDDTGDLEVLNRNFKVYAPGHAMPWEAKGVVDNLINILIENKVQLLVVDSLWKMSSNDSAKEETMKKLAMLMAKVKTKANCALIIIHHLKKKQLTKQYEGDLDDLMGTAYISAEADFVLIFVTTASLDANGDPEYRLRCHPAKIRYGKKPEPFDLIRTSDLGFICVTGGFHGNNPFNDVITQLTGEANS